MDDEDVVGVRLPDELQEGLMWCAVDQNRRIEDVIHEALQEYVERVARPRWASLPECSSPTKPDG